MNQWNFLKGKVMSDKKQVVFLSDVGTFTFAGVASAILAERSKDVFDKLDVVVKSFDSLITNLMNDDLTKIVVNLQISQPEIYLIRKYRKDIFVCSAYYENVPNETLYVNALNYLKENSLNLVLAYNDKDAMVVVPEESQYAAGSYESALNEMLEIAKLRSHLTFTRSTVIGGTPVSWDSEEVPNSLREVINYCIERGAYKQFRGSTVGHFAVKLTDTTFLTSIRRTNFNLINEVGLVKVKTNGPDSVIAYGAKPSVGGQSQRLVFNDHKEYDCIVHFHSPIKEGSLVPIVSQREFECGSHECGKNTSKGLKKFGNLSAVYLNNHGPNIVFNRQIDPQEVINFIEENFDLEKKTGGFVSTSTLKDATTIL